MYLYIYNYCFILCVCVCVCVCTAAHSVQACYIVFYDLISYASVCVMAKTAGWLLWLSLSELRRSSSRCADHPPYCFLSGLLNYSTSLVSWGLSMCCPAPLSCRALSLSLSLSLSPSLTLSFSVADNRSLYRGINPSALLGGINTLSLCNYDLIALLR